MFTYFRESFTEYASSLWPHAIGTQVCQNGDPISSEMGIKWGPCAAEGEPKKQMFAKLIETR